MNGVKAVIGQSADPEQDIITVHGKYVGGKPEPVYSPLQAQGYVTTLKDEHGRKTVRELVEGCGRMYTPRDGLTSTPRAC